MDAYTGFAEIYDMFMDETPYQKWAEYLSVLIEKYGISKPGSLEKTATVAENATDNGNLAASAIEEELTLQEACDQEKNLVVELGCGTGSLTELLAEKGYDMVGIDLSAEMLAIAMEKRDAKGKKILYLEQDMRELELYCTAGTIVSVCDSLNYLLTEEDLLQTFRLVNNYLYPQGLFVFDFNTVYKYEQIIGNTTITDVRGENYFIWDNYYDAEEQVNEYDMTFFVEAENGLYRKFEETHFQRGYTLETMKRLVEEAGMVFVAAFDEETHEAPTKESERIYILAREQGKG